MKMRIKVQGRVAAAVLGSVGSVTLGGVHALARQEPPLPVAAPATPSTPPGPFLVKPYLQLGDAPTATATEVISLLWHTEDTDGVWRVEIKPQGGSAWTQAEAPTAQRISVGGVAPHRVWTARMAGLAPGKPFTYRVLQNNKLVFQSGVQAARRGDKQNDYRFVVFGDCAAGTKNQRKVAYQAYLQKPDFVFVTGDIVYSRGRVSEYREKFFPVYNAEVASPETGAPLIRSTLMLAAPGNHDIGTRDLAQFPDSLAYFFYWSQPLNGFMPSLFTPTGTVPDKTDFPNFASLSGPEENRKAFLDSSGKTYPRMANFSYDWGGAHWTVIDANTYVNWNEPELRKWVADDLAKAKNAKWRFVGFHHPGFNSSEKHFEQQHMRLLAPLFEAGKVDIVFNGHVHNYQRSFPLRFAPAPAQTAKGKITGEWTLDKTFDGVNRTKPSGVIYLVTGAGGAGLYNGEQQTQPETWQGFTDKFLSQSHSLTVVDVKGNTLLVRQVDENGQTIDTFTVTK
jgi:predicted phosphodiesterase